MENSVSAIDSQAIMAELDREIRRRRKVGEFDLELEAELDAALVAVAPKGAFDQGFDTALTRAERTTIIETAGPVESRFPGVSVLRRVIRRLVAFYMEHVVWQVRGMGSMIIRTVRILGERVSRLEEVSPMADPRVANLEVDVSHDTDYAAFGSQLMQHFNGVSARIMHGDCGAGSLLKILSDAGLDVFGVDSRRSAAAVADSANIEVRCDSTLAHLRKMSDHSLGGLILSGCTDRAPLGDQLELCKQASRILNPGAPIAILGTHPLSHRSDPVAADLSVGRPLNPETWAYLLSDFTDVSSASSSEGASGANFPAIFMVSANR